MEGLTKIDNIFKEKNDINFTLCITLIPSVEDHTAIIPYSLNVHMKGLSRTDNIFKDKKLY